MYTFSGKGKYPSPQAGHRLPDVPRTSTRRWKRRRPGMPARRASSSISGGPGSKGRSPRGSAPLACDGPGIGAWRRPTCSTSRPPPPSISTVLSLGSTSAHGRRRASPVSPPSFLPTHSIQARQPPKVLASPTQSHPYCIASLAHILYYKNNCCSNLAEKQPRSRHLDKHTFRLFGHQCLL